MNLILTSFVSQAQTVCRAWQAKCTSDTMWQPIFEALIPSNPAEEEGSNNESDNPAGDNNAIPYKQEEGKKKKPKRKKKGWLEYTSIEREMLAARWGSMGAGYIISIRAPATINSQSGMLCVPIIPTPYTPITPASAMRSLSYYHRLKEYVQRLSIAADTDTGKRGFIEVQVFAVWESYGDNPYGPRVMEWNVFRMRPWLPVVQFRSAVGRQVPTHLLPSSLTSRAAGVHSRWMEDIHECKGC